MAAIQVRLKSTNCLRSSTKTFYDACWLLGKRQQYPCGFALSLCMPLGSGVIDSLCWSFTRRISPVSDTSYLA